MGRPKKQNREPFWKTDRACWYVQQESKQLRLAADKDEAQRLWHEFIARPPEVRCVAPPSGPNAPAVAILDGFLDWCLRNKAGRTYDWYRGYLESFARSLPSGQSIREIMPFHVQGWIDGKPTWKTGRWGAIIAA